MAGGLKGFVREPRGGARERRNAQRLATNVEFVGGGSVISLDGDGFLQLNLATNSGLSNSSGALTSVVQSPLDINSSGVFLTLATDPGLENVSGLRAKIKTNGGIARDSDGLSIISATATVVGGVLLAASRADSSQTTLSLTSVTNPADSPATADALRDDLVTNALAELQTRDGELETAVETLATEFNDLLSKLRSSGALAT